MTLIRSTLFGALTVCGLALSPGAAPAQVPSPAPVPDLSAAPLLAQFDRDFDDDDDDGYRRRGRDRRDGRRRRDDDDDDDFRESRRFRDRDRDRDGRGGSICVTARGNCNAGFRAPRNTPCRCFIPGFGEKRGAIGG